MTLQELERLHEGIEEALQQLPAGGDKVAAIRVVGRRLDLPTPDIFITDYLTAAAGGDVRFDPPSG